MSELLYLVVLACLISSILSNEGNYQWNRWSWSGEQRKKELFPPRKKVSYLPNAIEATTFECKCPPYKECVLDFKVNDAAVDFLRLRGVLEKADADQYKMEVQSMRKAEERTLLPNTLEPRRRSKRDNDEACCCPPAKHMVPTFITDDKFDELVDTFNHLKN